MYFVKFDNIAVFLEIKTPKLTRRGSISKNIVLLEDENSFKLLSKKSPYANCKRLDYFNPNGKSVLPNHIRDIIISIPEVVVIIKQKERDDKINSILED
jgi:hypothetical protein